MKKRSSIMAVVLASTMVFSSVFTACEGRGDYEEKIDKDKTQLMVQNFDGGIGTQWLYDLKERFEETYKDVSFETGKKGVQILITPNKEAGNTLSMRANGNDIVFTEGGKYYDWVAKGDLLDITDVAEKVFAQEGVSIDQDYYDALAYYDKDKDGKGEVYALPHYEVYGGAAYNKKIWNNFSLYIKGDADGKVIRDADGNVVLCNRSASLSVGPDGESGTYDDGLPSTWKDFFYVCDKMKLKGVTPFVLSGQFHYYTHYLGYAFMSAYGGYDEMYATVGYNTTINYVVNVEKNSNTVLGYDITSATEKISNAEGYKVQQLTSKMIAAAAVEKILKNDYLYKPALLGTVSHLNAQEIFINSMYNNKPIAMLIDGSWWENEADAAFVSLENVAPNHGKMKSDYGWMSFPNAIDENDTNPKRVVPADYDFIKAYALANAYMPQSKVKLAKTFLEFCYKTDELQAFTANTGISRGLNYSLESSDIDKLSSYSKEIWNYKQTHKIVRPISNNPLVIANNADIDNTVTSPVYGILNRKSFDEIDAKTWFTSFAISQADWNSQYGKYFN